MATPADSQPPTPMSRPLEYVQKWPQVTKLKELLQSQSAQSPLDAVPTPTQLQAISLSVDYSLASLENGDYKDRAAFSSSIVNQSLNDEMKQLELFHQLESEGTHFVSTLYSYRSVSRALPMAHRADLTDQEKADFHAYTFAILQLEIKKLRAFMEFAQRLRSAIINAMIFTQKQENERKVPSDDLYVAMLTALDLTVKLDALKDSKTSLVNDFSRYKRAFAPIRAQLSDADQLNDEITQLQMFLSNPMSPHNSLFFALRQDVQNLLNFDLILINLIHFDCDLIERRRWVTSEESHRYQRLLCHLLYLFDIDPKDNTKKTSVNVFKYQGKAKLDLDRVKRLARSMPIIPLMYDMHIDLSYVLKRIPHWEDDRMRNDWLPKSNDRKVVSKYSLAQSKLVIRPQFNDYFTVFTQQTNVIQTYHSSNQSLSPTIIHSYCFLVLEGLRLLNEWQSAVAAASAFKYANPASTTTSDPSANEYEKAVKYNYSDEELLALVDCIAMIKSLGSLLLTNIELIELVVRRCLHDDLQIFLQFEVGEAARKAQKHKRTNAQTIMLAMREWAGDFRSEKERQGWKDKNPGYSDSASTNVVSYYDKCVPAKDFQPRATTASLIQIRGVRRLMHTLFDDRSQGLQGSFFGSDKDLTKEQIGVWNDFYDWSFYWEYLIHFKSLAQSSIDFSFLWYREFYLELTKQIQFPISMSLPWILIEFLIKKNNIVGNNNKNNLLYALDIYNDAANNALTTLRQQYLYDEIEAESNLSFEQMVYTLAENCYKYYRTLANELLIKKGYLSKYLAANGGESGKTKVSIKENRYVFLFDQRQLTVLGRNIDLNLALTEQIHSKLRDHLRYVYARFEANDLTQIVEFEYCLRCWKQIHGLLAESLPALDSADEILAEEDDNVHRGQHRSRILSQVVNEVAADLVPNYVWNDSTARFVQAPQSFVERRERPKASVAGRTVTPPTLFSPRHALMLSEYFSNFRNYFGPEHVRALMAVLGARDIPALLLDLQSLLYDKLDGSDMSLDAHFNYMLGSLMPNIQLKDNVQINPLTLAFGAIDVAVRRDLNKYPGLRGGVLHLMREVGNILAFIAQLETESKFIQDTGFLFTAHFHSIKGQLTAMRSNDSAYLIRSEHQKEASYAAAIKDSAAFFNSMLPHSSVHGHLMTLAQQSVRMYSYEESQHAQSIVAGFLQRAHRLVDQRHGHEWRSHSLIDANNGSNDSLIRLLSCLLFIYCEPVDTSTAKTTDPAVAYLGKDIQLFGDGFLLALCLFVHSLNERCQFELIDYSNYLVSLEQLHPIDRSKFQAAKKSKTPQASADATGYDLTIVEFLRNVKLAKEKMRNYFALFERNDPNHPAPVTTPLQPRAS